MNEWSQIKKELNNILKNMKLPEETKKVINKIYKQYEEAYEKLLLEIKQNNLIDTKEIQKLENYIKNDYKEDKQITELVAYEEYEQERTKIVEVISLILINIKNKEKSKINDKIEEPKEKENIKASNMIISTTISEIKSSVKNIRNNVQNIKIKKQEIDAVIINFEEQIKIVVENANQTIPEITQILNKHYHEIYISVFEVINDYNKKLGYVEEKTNIEQKIKEEFKKRISNYEEVKNVLIDENKHTDVKQYEEIEH